MISVICTYVIFLYFLIYITCFKCIKILKLSLYQFLIRFPLQSYCMQKCADVANYVYEVHTKKRDREGETTYWRSTETHHMMDSHSFMRQVPLLNDCFVSERCLEH